MKFESFPKPVYKEPDSRGGAFDTKEMRRLREQLEQTEQIVQGEHHDVQGGVEVRPPDAKTEYEAINAAWDDVKKEEKTDTSAEPYTPEEAQAMIEELDRLHGANAEETESITRSATEVNSPDLVSTEEAESVLDEMSVRKKVGNTLADIEIAFGNSSHEIVQTARVMAEQVLSHLETTQNTESQSKWERQLQAKIDNLVQLRSDFVGPDGQKKNTQDLMDGVMPNAFQLQPELASKRRAEILAESGVSTASLELEQKNKFDDFRIEDLDSLESDFSDSSVTTEVPDAEAINVYTQHHAAVAKARGDALMKNYKPSGAPLGYDPKAPRATVKKPTPKKKGFLARLFGA